MKYRVIREVYERYENGSIKKSVFYADSDAEALKKVMENCMYGCEEEEISEEELVANIEATNGDGCDFIFSIQNLDTEKVLFEDGEYEVEDYEEDW